MRISQFESSADESSNNDSDEILWAEHDLRRNHFIHTATACIYVKLLREKDKKAPLFLCLQNVTTASFFSSACQ
jgi:hypothetical protein